MRNGPTKMSLGAAVRNIPALNRLVYLLTILALTTTHAAPGSWNDASRLATVQSLVEFHSFVIDKTAFIDTGDKVYIDGHFYSDKPPVPSVLGAVVYLPLYDAGIALHLGRSLPYYFITLLTVKLFWLLGTVAFFFLLKFTGLDSEKRLLASCALGIGSLYFSWSTTFNNHALAAAFLSIGFYFLIKARFEAKTALPLSIAALFLSLAGTADVPTGIFYVLFLLYVWRDARLRRGLVFYVLPLFVTVVPALACTYSIHHSILPVQIVGSYFQYPGSPWTQSSALSGIRANDAKSFLTYAVSALIGPKGFLLYNPILWIALWGLYRTIRRRDRFYYEAIVVAAGSSVLVLYYLVFTNDYSGWSYSIRWFVPLLPLLFFFLYPYFQTCDQRRGRQFCALFAVAVTIALVGAVDPWSHADLSEVPFIANIKELRLACAHACRLLEHSRSLN